MKQILISSTRLWPILANQSLIGSAFLLGTDCMIRKMTIKSATSVL